MDLFLKGILNRKIKGRMAMNDKDMYTPDELKARKQPVPGKESRMDPRPIPKRKALAG
jgi:hypothetical protein